MVLKLEGRAFEFDAGYGKIAVVDNETQTTRGLLPVLFIHGNSACKEAFHHQFSAPFASRTRMIAFDLPGHGGSDDAEVPDDVYRMGPMAAMARRLLDHLGASDAVLVGWSLGGHLAIELAGTHPVGEAGHRGLVMSGTPPFGPGRGEAAEAFNPSDAMALTAKEEFTAEEAGIYARTIFGDKAARDETLGAAVRRADGRMRLCANADWATNDAAGLHQKTVLAERRSPVAVIEGASEPFVNSAWMDKVVWGNLWGGKIQRISGAGHAPFLENPNDYNAVLEAFLGDL